MAVITIDDNNHEVLVANNDLVILLWAPWCNACKPYKKVFKELSSQYTDIRFAFCNIEENESLGLIYNVKSLPTTIFIRDKKFVYSEPGNIPARKLIDLIRESEEFNET